MIAVAAVGLAPRALLLVGYAAVVGVGIDLDHFALARLNDGDWRAVRRCLADPRIVVLDQDRIFRPGSVGTLPRLLSHVVVAGALVAVLAIPAPGLAVLTAVVLYLHVLADLYEDNRLAGTLPGQSTGGPDAPERQKL